MQGFYGATVSLGGGALLLGQAASTTVSVPGARVGMQVVVTPLADPGIGVWWYGFVSAPDVVTVRVIAAVAMTPTATVYSVAVVHQ